MLASLAAGRFRKPDFRFALLLGFLVSYVISAVLSVEYGLLESVKGFIWLTFEIVILYGLVSNNLGDREADRFVFAFVALTFVYSLVGIGMAVLGYGYVDWVGDYAVTTIGGMHAGRLYGMYSDPTYGGICGLVSLFFAFYLYVRRKGLPICFACGLNVVIQLSCLSLTGSRTVLVAGVVVVFAAVLIALYGSPGFLNRLQGGLRKACSVLVALTAAVLFSVLVTAGGGLYRLVEPAVLEMLGGPVTEADVVFDEALAAEVGWTGAYGLSEASTPAESEFPLSDSVVQEAGDGEEATAVAEEQTSSLGDERGVMSRSASDQDSGRLELWESALGLWHKAPVFGVSHRNIVEYAVENFPGSYIVNANLSTMHNVFVDILVSQGLVGFALFVTFMLSSLKGTLRRLMKAEGEKAIEIGLLFAGLLAITVSALFYSEIIYINTIGSVVFWFVAGYLRSDEYTTA